MEIEVFGKPIDGMREITVTYHETIDDFGYSARINVWVADHDSRAELENRAREAAKTFLKRALLAHDD